MKIKLLFALLTAAILPAISYAEGEAMDAEAASAAVKKALPMAKEAIVSAGFSFDPASMIDWKATNQLDKETKEVKLPKMLVGGAWVGQNDDASQPSPVVDGIAAKAGVPLVTLFQRINDAGDMLRIATTVKKKDGKRAIGTYIPAVEPDGAKNPVLEKVLAGNDFYGRALVVDKWCITGYSPLTDASGKIVGVIFVGVPSN